MLSRIWCPREEKLCPPSKSFGHLLGPSGTRQTCVSRRLPWPSPKTTTASLFAKWHYTYFIDTGRQVLEVLNSSQSTNLPSSFAPPTLSIGWRSNAGKTPLQPGTHSPHGLFAQGWSARRRGGRLREGGKGEKGQFSHQFMSLEEEDPDPVLGMAGSGSHRNGREAAERRACAWGR